DTARARGWQVRPLCSYVAAYVKRPPEYQDLVE
ncbi:MAG: N-acetyltransferase, partial [Castellaniella sp.]